MVNSSVIPDGKSLTTRETATDQIRNLICRQPPYFTACEGDIMRSRLPHHKVNPHYVTGMTRRPSQLDTANINHLYLMRMRPPRIRIRSFRRDRIDGCAIPINKRNLRVSRVVLPGDEIFDEMEIRGDGNHGHVHHGKCAGIHAGIPVHAFYGE